MNLETKFDSKPSLQVPSHLPCSQGSQRRPPLGFLFVQSNLRVFLCVSIKISSHRTPSQFWFAMKRASLTYSPRGLIWHQLQVQAGILATDPIRYASRGRTHFRQQERAYYLSWSPLLDSSDRQEKKKRTDDFVSELVPSISQTGSQKLRTKSNSLRNFQSLVFESFQKQAPSSQVRLAFRKVSPIKSQPFN